MPDVYYTYNNNNNRIIIIIYYIFNGETLSSAPVLAIPETSVSWWTFENIPRRGIQYYYTYDNNNNNNYTCIILFSSAIGSTFSL